MTAGKQLPGGEDGPVRLKVEFEATRGIGIVAYADEPPLPPGAVISDDDRFMGKVMIALAAAVAFWVWIADEPPLAILALCALLPLVAIVIARKYPNTFSVDIAARGPRVQLAHVLGFPAVAMFARAIDNIDLLDPLYVVAPALAGGYGMAVLCGGRRYSRVVMADDVRQPGHLSGRAGHAR